jgi:DNA-binding response OmpR family regulator
MTDDRQATSPALRIFLAEDDPALRQTIALSLRRDGHFVLESTDGAALVRDLGHVFWGEHRDTSPSLIITDVRMPGKDGLAIIRGIRSFSWCPRFIVITAFGDDAVHAEGYRLGAEAVLDKPFDLDFLRKVVTDVARRPLFESAKVPARR